MVLAVSLFSLFKSLKFEQKRTFEFQNTLTSLADIFIEHKLNINNIISIFALQIKTSPRQKNPTSE